MSLTLVTLHILVLKWYHHCVARYALLERVSAILENVKRYFPYIMFVFVLQKIVILCKIADSILINELINWFPEKATNSWVLLYYCWKITGIMLQICIDYFCISIILFARLQKPLWYDFTRKLLTIFST